MSDCQEEEEFRTGDPPEGQEEILGCPAQLEGFARGLMDEPCCPQHHIPISKIRLVFPEPSGDR